MSVYESFARVYDELMDDVPYEAWAAYLLRHLHRYGINGGLALELGCGTGKMTELLVRAGYDMIGVDASEDMLQIARERVTDHKEAYLYLLQDMRSFELYGTVGAVVSVCDSINYITKKEELVRVFALVNNYLDPKGIFIFDFNTDYKYREVIGDRVIAEDREDVSFIWDNTFEAETGLNYIDLNVFVQEKGDLYRKFQEEHIQRGYTLLQMQGMLQEAGMEFLEAFDDYSGKPADPHSERIVVIAREKGKRRP